MADREFVLKFIGDTKSLDKSVKGMEGTAKEVQGSMSGIATAIGGAFVVAGAVSFGKDIVNSASEQEQAIGGATSVFKEYADEVLAFGDTSASKLGLSKQAFLELSTVTGALLKNAGIPMDEVTQSTEDLTTRAADLASMFGTTVPEAMTAINAALKGEADPIERFGISLKASAVDAKAQAMGLVDAEGKVTDYGKSMARMALIMEQSQDAAGNFAKESGTLAGQTAIMGAQFEDLKADLGRKLLPVIVQLASVLRGLVTFMINNQGWLLPLAGAILAVVAGIKAWSLAQAAWSAATTVATGVQTVFNAVMAANPLGLIVIAIVAVVAAVVLLYTKVDWFRAFVDKAIDGMVTAWNTLLGAVKAVFNWVKSNWPLLLAIITGPIGLAVLAIQRNWNTIVQVVRTAIGGITNAVSTVWNIISAPFRHGAEIIGGVVDEIAEWFRGLPGRVASILSGVSSSITAPFRSAFNAIKSLWNNTVGGFGFTVPSWVPGVGGRGFRIPFMATGGVVTGPTVAMLGEAGPEAVIPLDRLGLGGVTINVYALTANAEVGRKVYESLQAFQRQSGRAVA